MDGCDKDRGSTRAARSPRERRRQSDYSPAHSRFSTTWVETSNTTWHLAPMTRTRCLLASLVLFACSTSGETPDAGETRDGSTLDANPCVTNPDCTVCGCSGSSYCCTEGECALQCVPRKPAGSPCGSDDECATRACGVAEVGDARCLVGELERCTEENCASCDDYVLADGSVGALCTRSCESDPDCSDFACVGTGCTTCVRNACRVECNVVSGCTTDYYCADDGICVPYDR